MKTYSASATIDADPQTVWDILVDTDSYPEWDPGMVRIEGNLRLGDKVKFFTKFSPEQAFAVAVTRYDPAEKLVFTGGMPLGLFKSERTHTLTANANGGTDFHTQEIFSGVLLPLFGKNIPDLTENFESFVAGLKQRAESVA